jgi:hypothetical protein
MALLLASYSIRAMQRPHGNVDVIGFLPMILGEGQPNQLTPTATNTHTPTNTPAPSPSATSSVTNTPTATPSSAATTTPSPTPTVSPTQPAANVSILANHSTYVDSIDYLHIVGEISNETANNLRFVRITTNVFDNNGQLLDTEFTYTYLDNLPAGDKTCFHVLMPLPNDWSTYEFEAPTYWTDGEPPSDLEIFNVSGSYDPTFGWYEIIGQVQNNAGHRIEFVSPVGTLYNNAGTVIGCDFTFVQSRDLDPGQTSAFEMTFTGHDYADADSYRLQVDGNPTLYLRYIGEQ